MKPFLKYLILSLWIVYTRKLNRKNYRLAQRVKDLGYLEDGIDNTTCKNNL